MNLNPYLAVILASTIGASSGVFVKLLNLPPALITFFRLSIPVLILFPYLKCKKVEFFRGDYKIMLFASLLNAVRLFFFIYAYFHASIGGAVIILFSWPIFAAFFGVIFLKEKLTKRTAALIFMAFCGIIIMYINKGIGFGGKDFLGMAAMLISAIVFSLMAIIFKKQLENYSRTEAIFYQNLVGAGLFLPFLLINWPVLTMVKTAAAVFYGFIAGIGAFLLFFYALKRLKISHYSLFSYWEVIAAIWFGVWFFDEKVTINVVIGGALIVLAGLLLKRGKDILIYEKD